MAFPRTSVVDALGNATSFTYNAAGELVRTVDALGLAAQPSITVDVDVIDLGYRIVRRGQGQGLGNRRIVGDVEFRFQSNSLSSAGRYTGELMITVNFL